jgi:dihydroorotase
MNTPDPDPLWIRGARVIDPASGRDEAKADLFAVGGRIVRRLTPAQQAKARKVDGKGLVACPGFVDLNCRLGQPGRSARETIHAGTRAAAAGGFTSVLAMPDTLPCVDHPGTLQLIHDICETDAAVRVLPAGTLTKGHAGQALAPIGSLAKQGVVAVTDTVAGVQNNEIMRRALEYAAMFGLTVIDHCQDSSMTEGAQMHEGAVSLRLGLRGFPAAAEAIVAASDCSLAELAGARMHLQGLSSAASVEVIRRARVRGVRVTADANPLHLLLTDAALASYDTNLKLNPPLREEADRQALVAALADGAIDAIASGHSPCTATEKDREFDLAPFGAATLEIAFAVAHEALVLSGAADLPTLVARLTHGPAKVLGIGAGTLAEGAPADLVLLDPKARWTFRAKGSRSLAGNHPLEGRAFRGRVTATYVGGRAIA